MWLNDPRHFSSTLVFQLILVDVIAKVIVQNCAKCWRIRTISDTRASIDFRLFDYNDIISSNKGDGQCV